MSKSDEARYPLTAEQRAILDEPPGPDGLTDRQAELLDRITGWHRLRIGTDSLREVSPL